MLDRDPIAQRHMAKINKYRGEYDKWGNRLTKSYLNVRHLLEDPDKPTRSNAIQFLTTILLCLLIRKKSGKNRRRRRQRQLSVEEEEEEDFDQVPYDDDDDVYGEGFLNVDGVKFGMTPSS